MRKRGGAQLLAKMGVSWPHVLMICKHAQISVHMVYQEVLNLELTRL